MRVAGQVVSGAGADRGIVFQEAALFPWLNVLENIELQRLTFSSALRADETSR